MLTGEGSGNLKELTSLSNLEISAEWASLILYGSLDEGFFGEFNLLEEMINTPIRCYMKNS